MRAHRIAVWLPFAGYAVPMDVGSSDGWGPIPGKSCAEPGAGNRQDAEVGLVQLILCPMSSGCVQLLVQ